MAARTNTADAGASALEPAPPVQVPSSATTSHANMAELVPSLPLETRWPPAPLRQYGGFWLPQNILPGVAAVHARFQPRPSDILLASFIKSGTTWLKALAFATMNRAAHPPSDADHPLRRRNPHDCVKFLELGSVLAADADASGAALDALEALPSPRLLSTHLPWSLLPRRVGESGCRVVYICRDPKDTLVSLWSVHKKMAVAGVDQFSFAFNDAFELFCEGRNIGGSQPRHVLEYWEEKQRRPDKVLFLVYEEVLREPERNLKRLAEFMGCAFTEEEEEAGVVQEIVELCSIDKMKNLEVNKKGTSAQGVRNEVFFRKGVAGDWRNHMTPEMAAKLNEIAEDMTGGSGLTLCRSV